jgi:hypothetical protein
MPDIELTERSARAILDLLKEYTRKIVQKIDRVNNVTSRDPMAIGVARERELEDLRRYHSNMRSAFHALGQSASQMLEISELEVATRIELRLRLAEFEHAKHRLDFMQ